jgi:hypothetical protein
LIDEFVKSLKDNFSLSDIIAFLSMVGSMIAAVFAWMNKRKAAKSEKQAEQYSKNADEANQSAKRYYNEMQVHLEKLSEQKNKEEQKMKILLAMDSGSFFTTLEVSDKVEINKPSVEKLLRELRIEKKVTLHCNRLWKIFEVENDRDRFEKMMIEARKESRDRKKN